MPPIWRAFSKAWRSFRRSWSPGVQLTKTVCFLHRMTIHTSTLHEGLLKLCLHCALDHCTMAIHTSTLHGGGGGGAFEALFTLCTIPLYNGHTYFHPPWGGGGGFWSSVYTVHYTTGQMMYFQPQIQSLCAVLEFFSCCLCGLQCDLAREMLTTELQSPI